jgi:hypothetical protein
MLQIYLDPCTVNSRKVLAGLDLLGTQYNLNLVSTQALKLFTILGHLTTKQC